MRNLIIVTGISGSGKSTISKIINQKYENSTLISLDIIKENIYDVVGYHNQEQKDVLKDYIYVVFENLLEICMKRGDERIILEFPFSKKWEPIFENLILKYNYNPITINITGNFDEIFSRLDKRNNSIYRHPCHSLSEYIPRFKEKYVSTNELDYNELKKVFKENKYTSLKLGKVINFENKNYDSIKTLIDEIDTLI